MTVTLGSPPSEQPHASSTKPKKTDLQTIPAERITDEDDFGEGVNPVLETSRWALNVCLIRTRDLTALDISSPQETNLVRLNDDGIKSAARYVSLYHFPSYDEVLTSRYGYPRSTPKCSKNPTSRAHGARIRFIYVQTIPSLGKTHLLLLA